MIDVLFVCLGNICRSPMAEAVFQHTVEEAGLADHIRSDSAGTGDWHVGETAHPGTLSILRERRIPYSGRARQISTGDLTSFDYILAMDRSNLRNIRRMMGDTSAEVSLFLHYAHRAGTVSVEEVPDPYYDGRFEYVYDLVQRGSEALLAHIRSQHGL
jgi:protein-tyrosine phosphatase